VQSSSQKSAEIVALLLTELFSRVMWGKRSHDYIIRGIQIFEWYIISQSIFIFVRPLNSIELRYKMSAVAIYCKYIFQITVFVRNKTHVRQIECFNKLYGDYLLNVGFIMALLKRACKKCHAQLCQMAIIKALLVRSLRAIFYTIKIASSNSITSKIYGVQKL
jgi:hypothetical protein